MGAYGGGGAAQGLEGPGHTVGGEHRLRVKGGRGAGVGWVRMGAGGGTGAGRSRGSEVQPAKGRRAGMRWARVGPSSLLLKAVPPPLYMGWVRVGPFSLCFLLFEHAAARGGDDGGECRGVRGTGEGGRGCTGAGGAVRGRGAHVKAECTPPPLTRMVPELDTATKVPLP